MSDHSLQASAQPLAASEPLEQALALQSRMPVVRIGEALLALGFVDERQLGDALARQTRERHLPLGELLVMSQAITRQQLEQALVQKMGFPVVDAGRFPVEANATREVPAALAHRLGALPLMARVAIDELEHCTALKVVPVLALAGTLRPAIALAYADTDTAAAPARPAAQPPSEEGVDQPTGAVASRLIERIVADTRSGAVTDVHVESDDPEAPVTVRARRGSVLGPYARLPAGCREPLVEQLKTMAQLDRNERAQPQVGLIDSADADVCPPLRVTTIPTVGGQEEVVVQRQGRPRLRVLTDLGLTAHNLLAFTAAIGHVSGLILCAGPQGSGRTTTMHAALAHLNTPERKIWTVEGSVDIVQRGLRQVKVHRNGEPTALRALQAVAHADADVVMIDAFDRHGFSASVCSPAFYLNVRDVLAPRGAMVANMVGPKAEREAHVEMIADVFGGNVIVLPIANDGNYLLFAFRDAGFEPRWRWIEGQAKAMQKRYGLDFPAFAARLKRSRKDGYLQRTMHQPQDQSGDA